MISSIPLDLNVLLARLVPQLRDIAGEQIEVQLQCAAGLPRIQVDVVLLQKSILGLTSIARAAMPQGGRLCLTTGLAGTRTLEAQFHPEAGASEFVCLIVGETGIRPEPLPPRFEPFYSRMEVGQGSGLGLASVFSIVQQNRGWLEVATQPGAGTAFKVFLPACRP